jgi:hypothetical protein
MLWGLRTTSTVVFSRSCVENGTTMQAEWIERAAMEDPISPSRHGQAAALQQEVCRFQNLFESVAADPQQPLRSKPAAAADPGSNASFPSINAHTSSSAVASARIETIVGSAAEETGPKISLMAPRGSPPVSASRKIFRSEHFQRHGDRGR